MTNYANTLTNTGSEAGEIKLESHQVMRIDHNKGLLDIRSLCGTLWVTIPNDPEDHLLQPGEHLPVKVKGPVVLQAMTEASFSLN